MTWKNPSFMHWIYYERNVASHSLLPVDSGLLPIVQRLTRINTPYKEDPKHPDRLTIKLNDWKPDNAKPAPAKEESLEEEMPF